MSLNLVISRPSVWVVVGRSAARAGPRGGRPRRARRKPVSGRAPSRSTKNSAISACHRALTSVASIPARAASDRGSRSTRSAGRPRAGTASSCASRSRRAREHVRPHGGVPVGVLLDPVGLDLELEAHPFTGRSVPRAGGGRVGRAGPARPTRTTQKSKSSMFSALNTNGSPRRTVAVGADGELTELAGLEGVALLAGDVAVDQGLGGVRREVAQVLGVPQRERRRRCRP